MRGHSKKFIAAFVLGFGAANALQALPFQVNDRIAFYGDSNTDWGSYPKHIQDYLSTYYKDLHIQVFNEGLAGDCISVGYYWRLDAEVFPKHPTVLFVMFGINDINWGRDLSDAAFNTFLTYTKLTIQKAFAAGVRDVYLLSYPATEAPLPGSDPQLCVDIPKVSATDTSPLQVLGDESIAVAKLTCAAAPPNSSADPQCGKGMDIERPMRRIFEVTSSQPLLRFHDDDGVHLNELGNKLLTGIILKKLGEPASRIYDFLKQATK